ncbi:TRAM/LAG1/CLN8 homology domain-containing protein [Cynara cardunculus var. scolymus]|uniref:TRAM/LAG1/CLN8 homology domain-containing protein n=1 Tax=Cynara cardunculus var. scolymus TaxID=59895 RepID=A0A103XSZ0_CYNCS|nr:TRAM/LAG1/CLN8 homology domain-containing protein [Cynara cardunculus var. scolymus]
MGVIDGLSSIDFGHESFPAYEDFLLLPLFAIFFPAVRFFLDRLVFEVVGRRLIYNNGQDIETEERNKKIRKFKESAWKCVYYLSAEILALAVTYDEPWFTNTSYFWIGPGNQRWPHQKMKLKLKALYMYVGGFYAYSIFALIFWETRRSDFGVSMGHHVASTFLIAMSYMFSYEVLQTLDKEKEFPEGPVHYYVFNTLLFCLLVLHIYWWVLIYRMLVKQIQDRGKLSDDVRSDSESDNDHQD